MRSTRKRILGLVATAAVAALALSGCSVQQLKRGFMPGPEGATNHTDGIVSLWNWAWIVLLIVGAAVWATVIWSMIVYRRRKGETGLPVQRRYHMPIEIMFTLIPVILIVGFYAGTVKQQTQIEARADETQDVVHISAIGKQWSWDFSYLDEEVHEGSGEQARYVGGDTFDESTLPTLYLPVNKQVEIKLDSYDVAHSFWITNFLVKKDMIPGKEDNYMTFIPQVEGTYRGKCAELCGEYHSMMLFNVKVVSEQEYEAHLAELKDKGNTGVWTLEEKRNQNQPGPEATEFEHEEE